MSDNSNSTPIATTRANPASITCILPSYNEAENLPVVIPKAYEYLLQFGSEIEFLVVDDGSRDNTVEVAQQLAEQYPVSLVKFSRNFGKEAALSAGIDHANGEVVIIMDADGQHPLNVISEFIEHWRNGYDMVYGVRDCRQNESAAKRYFTKWYYRILNKIADIDIHPDAGDFRLMSSNVVLALRDLPERSRMMKGLYAWVGFKSQPVYFHVDERLSGMTTFGLKQLSSLALTGLTAFSSVPLRVWMVVGAVTSGISFLYGLGIIFKTLFFGVDTPGWPTIAASIFFLGGIQLLSIGVLGEYLARVFSEVKKRPLYIVEQHQKHDAKAQQPTPAESE